MGAIRGCVGVGAISGNVIGDMRGCVGILTKGCVGVDMRGCVGVGTLRLGSRYERYTKRPEASENLANPPYAPPTTLTVSQR